MKPNHQILLVDRDPNDERIVRDVLQSAGFGIHVSTDGPSAMQAFHKIHPDLVLIDTEVADADGGTIGREMKESSAGHATPLVLMSAEKLGPSREAQALKTSGCATVLRKPITAEDLLETLTRLLPNAFIASPPAVAEPKPSSGAARVAKTKSPKTSKTSISPRSQKAGKPDSPFSDSFDEETLGTLLDQIFPGSDSGDVAGAIAEQALRPAELHAGTTLPTIEAATVVDPSGAGHPPIEPLNDEDSMDMQLDEVFTAIDDSGNTPAVDFSAIHVPEPELEVDVPAPTSHTLPAASLPSSDLDEFPLSKEASQGKSGQVTTARKQDAWSAEEAISIPITPATTAQGSASTLKSVSLAESLAELSPMPSPPFSHAGSPRAVPEEERVQASRRGLIITLLVVGAAAAAVLAALAFFLMRSGESDLQPARGGASSIPAPATSEQTELSTQSDSPVPLSGEDGASAGEVTGIEVPPAAGGVPTTDSVLAAGGAPASRGARVATAVPSRGGVPAASGVPAARPTRADAGAMAPFSVPAPASRRARDGGGGGSHVVASPAAIRFGGVNTDPFLQDAPPAFMPIRPEPPAHPDDAAPQDASTDEASEVSRDTDEESSVVQAASGRASGAPITTSPAVEISRGPENTTLAMPSEPVPAPTGGAGADEGDSLTSPVSLRRSAPEYPMIAISMKLTGAVKLLVRVEADGRVGDVKVTRSATPPLDEAARSAAYSWIYRPARRGTSPVATWVEETVEFKLR